MWRLLRRFCGCYLEIIEDYEGQQLAEKLYQTIITLFSIVGFAWGYYCKQFSQTTYIVLAGTALAALVTIPGWPMYRKKPLKWQEVLPKEDEKKK